MRLIHRWALERPRAFAAGFVLAASSLLTLGFFSLLLVVMWIDTEGCAEHLRHKCFYTFCDVNTGDRRFGDVLTKMGGEGEGEWTVCSPRYVDYATTASVLVTIFAVLFSPVWGMMIMVVRALALRARERELGAGAPPTA